MGLVFCDSMASYSSITDVARNWSGGTNSNWSYNATAGKNSDPALQVVSLAAARLWVPQATVAATAGSQAVGTGFWWKGSAAPASAADFMCRFENSSNTSCGSLRLATSGVLTLLNTSNTLLVTGVTNVCDNAWHWIEWYLSPNGTLQKCYVDGTQQWNGSFASGSNGNIANMFFGATGSAANTYTLYQPIVFDQQSSESPVPADIPIGPRVITTLRPSADSSVQFTPNSGANNYSRVNETVGDEDTSYVEDSTSGHADEYTYGALGFTPTSITAVQVVSRVKNPSGGSISYKSRCRSGSTVSDGAAVVAPAAYGNSRRCLNRDPDTAAAWTASGLGSAKFGITVV